MTLIKKPFLHRGFIIDKNITIKKRIKKDFFTEIYTLSNGYFFYLFFKIQKCDIKNLKYKLIEIKNGHKTFCGIITKKEINNNNYDIINNLTTARGLNEIAGMKDVKNFLISEVINPLKNPEKFKKFKVSIPNGILFYGPPGCGKSFIVRKLAKELDYNYIEIKASDIATPYIHGSVNNIGQIFSKAKEKNPTIICFNEISALVPNRKLLNNSLNYKEEETSEFLTQIEEAADNNILVIGTTNFMDRIDEAILRPGRLEKKFFIGKPDFNARKQVFKISLTNRPCEKNIDFNKLASLTLNFSCADIVEGIIETTARKSANLNLDFITQDLLEKEIYNYKI